ncbi:glycosylated lysosomal membrane protein B-like [Neocloeon triangulifer]|uniref:glycosylated lysosomal membrane protein B-like n=1 Tax=Neocloeon triangulifer TaxID=2078957 RepID=UPI00286F7B2D|nr:glycosylated lysosomal membrane protein B-like [Neocloeon triangulifer]XP_059475607.1 glycosylated lysosomal membrane protein B-like [Neocloeon triangulifer]
MAGMMSIFLLFCLLTSCFGLQQKRQLFWKLNPGGSEDTTVIHIRAVGTTNTIHYICSLLEKPSFLIAVTEPFANITINWELLMASTLDKCINFHPEPSFAFGFTINRILEVYGEHNLWPHYKNGVYSWHMDQFSWLPLPVEIGEKGCPLRFEFLGEDYMDRHFEEYKGTVSLVLKIYDEDGFDMEEILWHTINSSLLQISLQNFQPYFQNHSRFGLEFFVASNDNNFFESVIRKKQKSFENLVPEYFQVYEMSVPHGFSKSGGFMQWHRMAFTSSVKSTTSVIPTFQHPLRMVESEDFEDILIQSYFGSEFIGATTHAFNITFAYFGNSYYDSFNLLSWSFVFGYGDSPQSDINWVLAFVHIFGFSLISVMMTCCCCL